MSRKLTSGMLLQQAKQHPIFVHRFKWSHELRRKLTRRMCKDGLLVMIGRQQDGFLYRPATQKSASATGETR